MLERSCHSHPTEQTVLGMLDVRMSLEKVDAAIAESQFQMILVARIPFLMVGTASVYVLFHNCSPAGQRI